MAHDVDPSAGTEPGCGPLRQTRRAAIRSDQVRTGHAIGTVDPPPLSHFGPDLTPLRRHGNDIAETDCVAGVVGLELRNPLGSKSAGIAGGICADLGETAQQRGFASELRRCQRAAAARISPHDLHLSAEQIGNRGSAAAIRHVDQLIPVISI